MERPNEIESVAFYIRIVAYTIHSDCYAYS